jgi:Flp pilus assembly protein TadD
MQCDPKGGPRNSATAPSAESAASFSGIARVCIIESEKLARSGQSGAAIKLLEAGLEEHPTNVFFLNQAAYLYKRTGNSVKAIEYLERSRRINPRDMFTINTLGNLYAGQGRAVDAERVLTEGRRIDPNNMFIITTLGNLYAGQGRAADAERVLTEGRRIDPRFTSPLPTGMIFLPCLRSSEWRPQVALADDYQRSEGLTFDPRRRRRVDNRDAFRPDRSAQHRRESSQRRAGWGRSTVDAAVNDYNSTFSEILSAALSSVSR